MVFALLVGLGTASAEPASPSEAAPLAEADSVAEANAFLRAHLTDGSFYFVHISDTHIGGGAENRVDRGTPFLANVSPSEKLHRVLREIAGLRPRPAFIVITGDLTDHGTAEEFAALCRLLDETPSRGSGQAQLPLFLVRGNHDTHLNVVLDRMDQFPYVHKRRMSDTGFCYAFDFRGTRYLVLDSEEVEPGGRQLEWLDGELARAAGRPVVVFSHRNMGPTGHPLVDHSRDFSQAHADEILQRLFRHGRARWVFGGHAHINSWTQRAVRNGAVRPPINLVLVTSTFYDLGHIFSPQEGLYARLIHTKNGRIAWVALKEFGGTTRLDRPRPAPSVTMTNDK